MDVFQTSMEELRMDLSGGATAYCSEGSISSEEGNAFWIFLKG